MNGKQIIFRLLNGKTPASWSLKGGSAIKPGIGQKHIGYFPGSDSIFVEDNKDDRQMEEVVFEYNDELTDPATQIIVEESNTNLITYLKAHAFFNVHYAIHSIDAVSESKLEDFAKTEKALSLINEDDDVKTRAIAVAVFKSKAIGWSLVTCQAELKETAIKNPKLIIDAFESPNYEGNYLAALAFYSNIVTENNLHTAVVWTDGEGEITKLALGENGIEKLGSLLSVESDESRILMQEIGKRIEAKSSAAKLSNANLKEFSPVKTEAQIREEVREEERRKVLADLAKEGSKKLSSDGDLGKTGQATKSDESEESKKESDYDSTNIDVARAKYLELFGKEVANLKKNDLDWINNQILTKLT